MLLFHNINIGISICIRLVRNMICKAQSVLFYTIISGQWLQTVRLLLVGMRLANGHKQSSGDHSIPAFKRGHVLYQNADLTDLQHQPVEACMLCNAVPGPLIKQTQYHTHPHILDI